MIHAPIWGELACGMGEVGQSRIWARLDTMVVDETASRNGLAGLDDRLVAAAVPGLSSWGQVELARSKGAGEAAQLALARVRRVSVWRALAEREDLCARAGAVLTKWHHPRIDYLVFDKVGSVDRAAIIARFSKEKRHRSALGALVAEYGRYDLVGWCGSSEQILRLIPTGVELDDASACRAVLTLAEDPGLLVKWANGQALSTRLAAHVRDLCEGPALAAINARAGVMALMVRSEYPRADALLGALRAPGNAALGWIRSEVVLDWDTLEVAYGGGEFSVECLGLLAGRKDCADWVLTEAVRRGVTSPMPNLEARHLLYVLGELRGARVGAVAALIASMKVRARPSAAILYRQAAPVAGVSLLLEWFVGDAYREAVVADLAGEIEGALGGEVGAWETFVALVEEWDGTLADCVGVAKLLAGA